MITLSDLHKAYPTAGGPLPVLKGIDLHIDEGELVAIMGSSGSGKSTLLNVLGILDGYDTGAYELDGQLVRALSEADAARLRSRAIGFVFQSFHLLAHKDATENVALPLYYQGIGRAERMRRARQMLVDVGLADRADHMPGQLSGGQKQRVAIARALVTQPRLILADEPTGALDSTTSDEIMALLQRVNDQGMTVLIVTHEHDIAARCRRVVHLKDGRIERDERREPQGAGAAP
ncbi:MAG: ABC transporter ATP-binding protein [Alphaproteobacteria bacterium]|nr:ABC transporter ATP-binding protein [Alphaproteobacteria bacterium]